MTQHTAPNTHQALALAVTPALTHLRSWSRIQVLTRKGRSVKVPWLLHLGTRWMAPAGEALPGALHGQAAVCLTLCLTQREQGKAGWYTGTRTWPLHSSIQSHVYALCKGAARNLSTLLTAQQQGPELTCGLWQQTHASGAPRHKTAGRCWWACSSPGSPPPAAGRRCATLTVQHCQRAAAACRGGRNSGGKHMCHSTSSMRGWVPTAPSQHHQHPRIACRTEPKKLPPPLPGTHHQGSSAMPHLNIPCSATARAAVAPPQLCPATASCSMARVPLQLVKEAAPAEELVPGSGWPAGVEPGVVGHTHRTFSMQCAAYLRGVAAVPRGNVVGDCCKECHHTLHKRDH